MTGHHRWSYFLFENIVGYDTLKSFLVRELERKSNNHILLHGPPGIAKSDFLKDIARMPKTEFVSTATASKEGLMIYLINRQVKIPIKYLCWMRDTQLEPRLLCID